MAKKWEKLTKNQKLDMLRAELSKIVVALSKLTRRLDEVERKKSKRPRPKRKPKKDSQSTLAPPPAEPVPTATVTTEASSTAE